MGFFGGSNSKDGKRKKNLTMASIFQESVIETVLEEFKANKDFTIEDQDGDSYVGFLLKASDIGGLGKKSIRDEAKGQIIEEMRAGRIKTYMPQELLDEDKMVIIPDSQTLTAMEEFTLLTQAKYTVAYIKDDGTVEETDSETTYKAMTEVSNDDYDIYELLANAGEDWAKDDGNDDEDDSEPEDDAPEDEIDEDSELEDDPDAVSEDVVPEQAVDEDATTVVPPVQAQAPAEVEAAPQSDDVVDDVLADDGADVQGVDDQPQDDPYTVTPEQMQEAITRRFYADDLGLEVSTDAFDAQFLHSNPYVPFDEDRGDGWLNLYLNQMSKDANVEMQRLHQKNLFEAREKFFNLLSRAAEQLQKDTDIEHGDNEFAKLYNVIRDTRTSARNNVDRMVSERKKELQKQWEEKLDKVGEDGARMAQQDYTNKFGREHENKVYNIERDINNQIESEYNDAIRKLQDTRRKKAATYMDYNITEALNAVQEEYLKNLEEENAEYKAWRKKINDFIDTHRKDEVAHDRVLATELAQSQKADKVMAEYTERLRQQTEEFEARKQSMKAELEETDRKTDQMLRQKQVECDARIAQMQKHLDDQKTEMNNLLDKYSNLDKNKEEQFKARLAEAHDERVAWQDKCENIINLHKKANLVSIMLAIVAVVAAASIGVLVGSNLNLDLSSKNVTKEVANEYARRLDKLEQDKHDLQNKLNQSTQQQVQPQAQVQPQVAQVQPQAQQQVQQPVQPQVQQQVQAPQTRR